MCTRCAQMMQNELIEVAEEPQAIPLSDDAQVVLDILSRDADGYGNVMQLVSVLFAMFPVVLCQVMIEVSQLHAAQSQQALPIDKLLAASPHRSRATH